MNSNSEKVKIQLFYFKKIRCVKASEKSHAISLYLIEPATCEYLVSIESTWLCDYIEKYDGNIKANIND